MKRPALVAIGAVALLVGILAGAAGLLLGTGPGASWLLTQVQNMAPATIQLGLIRGHFFGRLELHDIRLRMEAANIDAESLVLDWSPLRLLRGELLINQLSVAAPRYAGVPVEPGTPAAPGEAPQRSAGLPSFSPPLRLVVRKAELTDAQLIPAPGASPLHIDRVFLRAHWGDEGLVLTRLDAEGPAFFFALQGRVDPLQAYATQLENRASVTLDDGPAFKLQGTIQGDIARLEMAQQITGAVQVDATASLDRPLEQPGWQALISIREWPGDFLGTDLPVALHGDIDAAGDMLSAAVSGAISSRSAEPELDGLQLLLDLTADAKAQSLALNRVELTRPGQAPSLSLRGRASAQALAIDGEWSALQWPLASARPSLRSERGRLSLSGAIDDYRLELTADIEAQDIADGSWVLSGRGDRRGFVVEQLNGGVLGGELRLQGDLGWSPRPVWELGLTARGLRPGSWLADPEAVVNLAATTSGSVGEAGPQAHIVLQKLGGRLNGQPLTGDGRLSYTAERIEVERLSIENADATLFADGLIGEQSDLNWRLQIPDLGHLVARAAGSISSQGRLTGARQAPSIVGEADIRGLALPSLRIADIRADIDLDILDRRSSAVIVAAQGLTAAGNRIEQLRLGLDGFTRKHQLTLEAAHAQAAIELAAQGGFEQGWGGELTRFDIDSQALGQWHLREAVELSLSTEDISATPLCLAREHAQLCAQGNWQAGGEASGSLDLAGLPLTWLRALLPEQLEDATGVLTLNGQFRQADDLLARVDASLTPGELVLGGADGTRLPHDGASLELDAAGQGAEASLRAGLGRNRLQASVRLPDILTIADRQQARVAGKLSLAAPELELLPLLLPAISRVDGRLNADIDVGGELGKPLLHGAGLLDLQRLDLDQLGLALSDTRVDVDVAQHTVTLEGSSRSGGHLNLHGELLLDRTSGWPLALSVKGKDFVAIDTPSVTMAISPDLALRRGTDAMTLTGTLAVPLAEIIVRDLPSGSRSASPDIVIVGSDDAPIQAYEDSLPLDTHITLVLGDKVHLSALGLDGFLVGELAVRGRSGRPLHATGDLRLSEAIFRAYGQRLEIERGLISYTNSPLDNPGVNVRAGRTIGDVQVGVTALGSAKKMTVTTFSSPSMSENDRISYLVTGKPSREGASLTLDRQIAKNLTVGVTVDTQTGERAFLTRYRLHRSLYTEVSSSARSSAVDLFYTIERE